MKLLLILILVTLTACSTQQHRILAVTGTVIGLEIAQNPQTQMYTAKLGFNRGEIVTLPTNRGAREGEASTGNGAGDAADVLMELRYGNIFSLSEASIYQRLAVGSVAVSQPGAAFMFAKDKSGTLAPDTASAVAASLRGIPAPDANVTASVLPLAEAYSKSTNKPAFDAVAQIQGFRTFAEFLISPRLTADKVQAMSESLKHVSLLP